MITIIFSLFLLYFILYEPIAGWFDYKKFSKKLLTNPDTRLTYYKTMIIGLLIPTIVLLFLLIIGILNVSDIGLTIPVLTTGLLNPLLSYAVWVISALLFLLTLYQLIAAKFSKTYQEKMQQMQLPLSIDSMLPRTAKEKQLWTYVSLSAAVCEELLYRGLLIFIITYFIPDVNVYICILIASLIFGISHAYQGVTGVLKTSLYGLLLSMLYVSTGSILLGILIHFLTDFSAKDTASSA